MDDFGRMAFFLVCHRVSARAGSGFGQGEVLLAQARGCQKPPAEGSLVRGAVELAGDLTAWTAWLWWRKTLL